MDREMLKGSIDILIMGLLYRQDMYGYDIAKNLKKESNDLYQISEGTLYPALKRLEGKDYLTSYWKDTEEGKRRKYYHLTDEGKKAYMQKIKQWETISSLVHRVTQGDFA